MCELRPRTGWSADLWLIEGNSLRELIEDADLAFIVFASIRVVHLAAVLTALVFM